LGWGSVIGGGLGAVGVSRASCVVVVYATFIYTNMVNSH